MLKSIAQNSSDRTGGWAVMPQRVARGVPAPTPDPSIYNRNYLKQQYTGQEPVPILTADNFPPHQPDGDGIVIASVNTTVYNAHTYNKNYLRGDPRAEFQEPVPNLKPAAVETAPLYDKDSQIGKVEKLITAAKNLGQEAMLRGQNAIVQQLGIYLVDLNRMFNILKLSRMLSVAENNRLDVINRYIQGLLNDYQLPQQPPAPVGGIPFVPPPAGGDGGFPPPPDGGDGFPPNGFPIVPAGAPAGFPVVDDGLGELDGSEYSYEEGDEGDEDEIMFIPRPVPIQNPDLEDIDPYYDDSQNDPPVIRPDYRVTEIGRATRGDIFSRIDVDTRPVRQVPQDIETFRRQDTGLSMQRQLGVSIIPDAKPSVTIDLSDYNIESVFKYLKGKNKPIDGTYKEKIKADFEAEAGFPLAYAMDVKNPTIPKMIKYFEEQLREKGLYGGVVNVIVRNILAGNYTDKFVDLKSLGGSKEPKKSSLFSKFTARVGPAPEDDYQGL